MNIQIFGTKKCNDKEGRAFFQGAWHKVSVY